MKFSSEKLSTNVVGTHRMLSDSRPELLGLAVPPGIFNTITNITFTRPVNPGPQTIMRTNASVRAVLVSQERHRKAISQFKEVEDSDQVLKTQLLQSFD